MLNNKNIMRILTNLKCILNSSHACSILLKNFIIKNKMEKNEKAKNSKPSM